MVYNDQNSKYVTPGSLPQTLKNILPVRLSYDTSPIISGHVLFNGMNVSSFLGVVYRTVNATLEH